ncbi:putative isomerase YbhE [Coprinopsis marcescibilis]|uniref:Putative isomerase YbhE n=1 Tax=Coprinopsis marcescibilis TaxID=230819 RepID=A0A5C3KU01_COPMA|nr:putative isomerase YbhE [Coprinopsis marcescibilis]
MVSFKILAGGYSTFIATYLFNTTPQASTLEVISRSPTGINPSWLSFHPTNKSLLYTVNEYDRGAVQSFLVKEDGSLSSAIDVVSSSGESPAHVIALKSTGQVVAMNYNSGNGRIINATTTGRFVAEVAQTVTFQEPAGPISHPHQAYEYKDKIWVPDLGLDTIWRLVPDQASGQLVKVAGSIPQPKGSGPRHISIYKQRLFVLHELSSTLTVQKIPDLAFDKVSIIANVSIAPEDGPADAIYAAAEILIPPLTRKFPKSYIYVSNRNKGETPDPRGDSIAIFEHVYPGTRKEGLKLVKQVFTGLSQIRGMEFGPAKNGGDEFLVAAASNSTGGVIVLKRVKGGRDLEIVAKDTTIGTRTSLVWVD